MKTLYLNLFLLIFLIPSYEGNAQSLQDYFKIASQNNPGLQAKYKEFEAALQKVPEWNSVV